MAEQTLHPLQLTAMNEKHPQAPVRSSPMADALKTTDPPVRYDDFVQWSPRFRHILVGSWN